jgi:hypothetical protein
VILVKAKASPEKNAETSMKQPRSDHQFTIPASAALTPPDEPVFLLRGLDICAPATVRFWAQEAQEHGVHELTVKAALQVAADMEAWLSKQTAGNALNRLLANPKNSPLCYYKPSGRMAPTAAKSSD